MLPPDEDEVDTEDEEEDNDNDEDNYDDMDPDSPKPKSTEKAVSKHDNIPRKEDFDDVIGDLITTGFEDGRSPDNLLMEIKGFKFAQNKVFIFLFDL